MDIQSLNSSVIIPNQFDSIRKSRGLGGFVLYIFGFAEKIKGADNKSFYIKKRDLVKSLVGDNKISSKVYDLALKRLAELSSSQYNEPMYEEKLKLAYSGLSTPLTEENVISHLDHVVRDNSGIENLYCGNLSEIVDNLQPGDILVRKYDESYKNPICIAQKALAKQEWRQADKCSHIALYLGKRHDGHWIMEASMPHGNESEIRRIKIDEDRFAIRPKNQYLVIRNKNTEIAKATANLASKYCVKMLPEGDRKNTLEDKEASTKYSMIEAIRSLYHSAKHGFFSKQRLLKFEADRINGVPFEYLGKKRGFFCSNFVTTMQVMAEAESSKEFKNLVNKETVPRSYDQSKKGLGLSVSKIWYSIRKGVWARKTALFHSGKLDRAVTTKLDLLRVAPSDLVNYCKKASDQFEFVYAINRKEDLLECLKSF